jgi:hypothetical protein
MFPIPLQVTNIAVALGATMTLTVDDVQLRDYETYNLIIAQELPANVGTEAVSVIIDGATIPLIDNAGNLVVAGKIRGGRFIGINVAGSLLRIQFGSNGMPAAEAHFVVHAGLHPMRYNGTAGAENVAPFAAAAKK